MLAEDLRFHRGGMDLEDGCEVRLEAQAVEPGARAENAVMLRDDPREIRQWVWRIGNHEKHGFWRGLEMKDPTGKTQRTRWKEILDMVSLKGYLSADWKDEE